MTINFSQVSQFSVQKSKHSQCMQNALSVMELITEWEGKERKEVNGNHWEAEIMESTDQTA